jgi:Rad3-related DNA helicase
MADGILISASAWEGVDLPGMINNLVITRLPFSPPATVHDRALEHALIQKGYSRKSAQAAVFSRSLLGSRRKFRQGLGRSIRCADDHSKIWICDPRFPPPNDQSKIHKSGHAFLQSIPKRFREAVGSVTSPYERATIWGRGAIPKKKKNPW